MELSEFLRKKVAASGLKHDEIASRMSPTKRDRHPSRAMVTQWLLGREVIPVSRVIELAEICRFPVSEAGAYLSGARLIELVSLRIGDKRLLSLVRDDLDK